jgi:hypothetical protein
MGGLPNPKYFDSAAFPTGISPTQEKQKYLRFSIKPARLICLSRKHRAKDFMSGAFTTLFISSAARMPREQEST